MANAPALPVCEGSDEAGTSAGRGASANANANANARWSAEGEGAHRPADLGGLWAALAVKARACGSASLRALRVTAARLAAPLRAPPSRAAGVSCTHSVSPATPLAVAGRRAALSSGLRLAPPGAAPCVLASLGPALASDAHEDAEWVLAEQGAAIRAASPASGRELGRVSRSRPMPVATAGTATAGRSGKPLLSDERLAVARADSSGRGLGARGVRREGGGESRGARAGLGGVRDGSGARVPVRSVRVGGARDEAGVVVLGAGARRRALTATAAGVFARRAALGLQTSRDCEPRSGSTREARGARSGSSRRELVASGLTNAAPRASGAKESDRDCLLAPPRGAACPREAVARMTAARLSGVRPASGLVSSAVCEAPARRRAARGRSPARAEPPEGPGRSRQCVSEPSD